MRGLVAAGALVLVVAGCGGAERTAAPVTTPRSPSVTSGVPTSPARTTEPPSPTPARSGATSPATVPSSRPGGARLAVGGSAYVDVAVATLWVSPSSPRAVDRPALGDPVDIRGWLAAMGTDARRGLVGRVETQALLGDRVVVTALSGEWAKVVAVGQRTHRDARGYPGWVPAAQLTARPPLSRPREAVVVALTTPLRDAAGRLVVEASFGTRLPVLSADAAGVHVATPAGAAVVARTADVALVAAGAAPRSATAGGVMATARGFTGVPYLWGGRSGFAVDCSGFTGLVYAVHGVTLPRDADDQAVAGRAVSSPRAADLAFFVRGGAIGHVGFVTGDGQLLHAPGSGSSVRTVPLSTVAGYSHARRFV